MRKIASFFFFFAAAFCGLIATDSSASSVPDAAAAAAAVAQAADHIKASNAEAAAQTMGLAAHGWAVIDRIRNATEFPVDVFYNKTLHDLLPPGTEIRIKSLKREYALEAAALADEAKGAASQSSKALDNKNVDSDAKTAANVNQKAGGSSKTKRLLLLSSATNENNADGTNHAPQNVVDKKSKESREHHAEKEQVQQAFRYLAARNLAGNFRLKADTTDAEDPATLFVVRKHICSDLQTFLGIEAKVNPGQLIRTKLNNEAVFSKQTTLESIAKDGAKSNDNFDSDYDSDAHWFLYSKGIKPEDPINPEVGGYLDSCSLKNRARNAFLSVRGAQDAKGGDRYVKSCHWYWAQGPTDQNVNTLWYMRLQLHRDSNSEDGAYTTFWNYFRMPIDRNTPVPLDAPYVGLKQLMGFDYGVVAYRDTLVPQNVLLQPMIPNGVLVAGPTNKPATPALAQFVGNLVEGGAKFNLFQCNAASSNSRWQTMWNYNAAQDTMLINFLEIDDALMVYNQLRKYTYLDSAEKSNGASVNPTPLPAGVELEKWGKVVGGRNRISTRSLKLAKKERLNYGDKIKIASTGSYQTLFGANLEYENTDAPGIKIVFASNDDVSSEYNKLKEICNSRTPEENSWFYIKGAHADGDAWNCKIGSPVQDGDIIRLENVVTGRNLTVVRGTSPPPGLLFYGHYKGTDIVKAVAGAGAACDYAGGKKPKEHEYLVGLSKGSYGLSSSDDNFIIKFVDPSDNSLCKGQIFSLVHQNCKQNLWSQHAYFKQSGKLLGLVTALFPSQESEALDNGWFVYASESSTLPVKDVAWVGIPDGAAQTGIGDSEELAIEVVKLGLAGDLGPGQTLTVKMPLNFKDPKVSGYAKSEIPNFSIANVVNLNPLRNEGIAWLEESLETPNKASIFFRAKCQDTGDIQIFLGNNISLDYLWKIVIGGDGNAASYILRKDNPGGISVEKKVVEVFKTNNPYAVAIPGQYTPYWISICDGLVMVGQGSTLGENIIMVWRDLVQRDEVNRVGFGSGLKAVSYAEVRIAEPLEIKGPKNFYFTQNSPLPVNSENLLTFDSQARKEVLTFKVPGNGTLVFNVNGEGELYCFNDDGNKSFATDASNSDIRVQSIINELAASLAKKIMTLRNVLGLQQFFQKQGKGNKDDDVKTISDFFYNHPNHSLRKYFDTLTEQQKTSDDYAKLSTMLEAPYKDDVQGSWSVSSLKTSLTNIVGDYLKDKFSDELSSSLYTEDLKNNLAGIVLGTVVAPASTATKDEQGKNDAKLKDPNADTIALVNACKSWISTDAVLSQVQKTNKVNDHYRTTFQSFDTILAKREAAIAALKLVLQKYLSIIRGELAKNSSYSHEAMTKVLKINEKKLTELLKAQNIINLNTGDINGRIASANDLLAASAKNGTDPFNDVFPKPLLAFYVQVCPDFSEACIKLEKYNPVTAAYETLSLSKDQDSADLNVTAGTGKDFWLSFNKCRCLLGRGNEVGKNLLLYAWDINNPYDDVQKFGFKPKSSAVVSKIKIGNTVKISEHEQASGYRRTKKLYDYKGSLNVIAPYEYHLSQADQQVMFKDIIGKKTLFPGKTPQQGALYYFTLILQSNGFPELQWTKEPENPEKLELEKSAAISQANADAFFQAASMVQGGMSMTGGLLGAAASIGFAGGGISSAKDAASKNAQLQTYRAVDAYAFTDNMGSVANLATNNIPPEVLDNKSKAEEQLALGEKWTPSDVDKLQRLIPLYNSVLDYITHPYVIFGSKNRLFSGINACYKAQKILFAAAKTVDMTQIGLLSLLVKAYNNSYIIDPTDENDLKLKGTWYSYINELAQTILNIDQKELTLPACYGEYIWLPDEFKTLNKGSISFQAKAANDIFVCFAENAVNVRNTDSDIYEIVLGAFGNTKSIIRAKSLDKEVAATDNPDALVNPVDVKQYWVSFNNGRILIGTGDLTPENAIGRYDPESREIVKPEWGDYSYEVSVNKDWLKYAIGDAKGFKGKDLLLKDLSNASTDAEKTQISAAIAERKAALTQLFNKKIYPYQTAITSQGSYSTDPFYWQDPYFNPKKARIKRVGISSWNSEVYFKNVKVSVCVEEISLYIKNLMAQINNSKDQPIFDGDVTLDEYRQKVLASFAAKSAAKAVAVEPAADDSSAATPADAKATDNAATVSAKAPAVTNASESAASTTKSLPTKSSDNAQTAAAGT